MKNAKMALFLIEIKQKELAKVFGVSQQNVSTWARNGVPAKYIKKISELTGGKVTIDELLADHEVKA